MKHNEEELSNALNILITKLKNDPDYRMSWQANIAMAYQDATRWDETGNIHTVANKAADYFLNILCR